MNNNCKSNNNWDIVYWTILIIFIVIFVTLVFFFILRKCVLFQPSKDIVWKPNHPKEYKNIFLVVNDENHNDGEGYTHREIVKLRNSKIMTFSELQYINVWYFDNFPGKKVVLYYHGNNDNISYREYAVNICKRLELNLLLVDYRGYGQSSSVPSSKGLLEDAITAYSFIKQKYSSSEIIIWGESLGGIAAIYTAAKYKCSNLVLLSTFYNLNIIIDNMTLPNNIKNIIKRLSKDKNIKNNYWIKKVKCPVTIIHSKFDDILPYLNGELLCENVNSINKTFISIEGSHGHPYFKEKDLKKLLDSLEINDPEINNKNNIENLMEIINNLE